MNTKVMSIDTFAGNAMLNSSRLNVDFHELSDQEINAVSGGGAAGFFWKLIKKGGPKAWKGAKKGWTNGKAALHRAAYRSAVNRRGDAYFPNSSEFWNMFF